MSITKYAYGIFLLVAALLVSVIDTSWKGTVLCWFLVMIGILSCFIGRYSKSFWLKNWLNRYF
ncbi:MULTISPECIES: hypothetical protein [unclassified Sulfurospirillum]|uniref:hypothetical protein n=1 Tax=unclassified Sulfurospirillum TaxID=2618290 RepID=UPI0005027DCC|nr:MULTISPECIES: hypothetical protein [unclassified Sulfurospirillum]KFL34982.1 hypothetical protein JU57_03170 [Sulfurospirillum sp. SCADC]